MNPPQVDPAPAPVSRVRNDRFNAREGFQLGRPKVVFLAWYLVKCVFFLSPLPWPSGWRCALLRLFGAHIGTRVYLKPRINIHFPWNLSLGDHTWVGEEVCIINFAPVTVGAHCCLSQRAFLCSGSHDYRAENMRYRHEPIHLADGVWVAAQAFIGPGVTVQTDAVVTAGSVVTRSLPPAMVCGGNPATPLRPRWK